MKKLALCAILSACMAATAPFKPVTVAAPTNAYQRALQQLTVNGETIDTKDESAGVITTKWTRFDTLMNLEKQVRWVVTVSASELTVSSQCQLLDHDPAPGQSAEPTPCAANQQPADRSERALQLAKAIQGK